MKRPGLVWGVVVGGVTTGITVLDLWCDRRHDDSTLSCCVRRLVHQTPGGRYVLAAGLTVAGVAFYDHIAGPLTAAVTDVL